MVGLRQHAARGARNVSFYHQHCAKHMQRYLVVSGGREGRATCCTDVVIFAVEVIFAMEKTTEVVF